MSMLDEMEKAVAALSPPPDCPVAVLVSRKDWDALRQSPHFSGESSGRAWMGLPIYPIAGLQTSVTLRADGTVEPLPRLAPNGE